jgi:hypothetical protein
LPDGKFLIARGRSQADKGCSGRVLVAHSDPEKGLVVKDENK